MSSINNANDFSAEIECLVASRLCALGCQTFGQLGGHAETDLMCITPHGDKLAIQVKAVTKQDGKHYGRVAKNTHGERGYKPRKYYRWIDFFIYYGEGHFWIISAPKQECLMVSLKYDDLEAWHKISKDYHVTENGHDQDRQLRLI